MPRSPAYRRAVSAGSGVRQIMNWSPVLPVIGTVTLEESLNLSDPQFPGLQNGMVALSSKYT